MDDFFNRLVGWSPRPPGLDDVSGDPERDLTFEEARRLNCMASHIGMTPADYDPTRVPRYAAVELEYNGICMCWTPTRGPTTLEGVPMRCAEHLSPDFEDMQRALGEPTFFQAEYVVPGGLERTNGAFQSGHPTGGAIVFEAVPMSVWDGGLQSAALYVRRRFLAEAHAIANPQIVLLAQHAEGFDQEGIELAAGVVWEEGDELFDGLIVKDLEAPFIRRRDRAWMKVKRQQSDDLPIQSVMKHPDGTVMKIICTRAGQPIAVPNGFARWADQPDEFRPGRIVEIAHDGVTKGGYLLSPRFKRFRDDKGA